MIDIKSLIFLLKKNKINFFTGVPDSLLKEFCACVNESVQEGDHVIAANEGAATGTR